MPEQVITPRIRGFLCLNAHPAGCAANVAAQIKQAQAACPGEGISRVLVIGSSTGYGLSSLITSVFGYGADAVSVCFEKPSDGKRCASAGWYNLAAVHQQAQAAGRKITTINGDAFSADIKAQTIAAINELGGPIDLVVYSLASPRRTDQDGVTHSSVLKPLGGSYSGKSIDLRDESITEVSIDPATEEEAAATVKVMGGEDWAWWMNELSDAGLLAQGCRSVAYSYIGPKVTEGIYRSGTIGKAKEHIEATARDISNKLAQEVGGAAWISVNKALVTQASSAIPVVPLYTSLLFKVMKAAGNHEGTIEQIIRLYVDHIAPGQTPQVDEAERIRIDDWELEPAIQSQVDELWPQVTTENLREISDYAGFALDFRRLFGFDVDGVDYEQAVEIVQDLV